MPTELKTKAVEESTYVVNAAFTDEDGAAVVPNTGLNWTLTDDHGVVINSRDAVAITPATAVDIVLKGDDLAMSGDSVVRVVTIEGTYDSGTLGAGLPIKDRAVFDVVGLASVT